MSNGQLVSSNTISRNGDKMVKTLALISLVLFATIELYFFKINYHPVGYAASGLLLVFGIWRIATEQDRFQKIRIITIVSLFVLFWLIIPVILTVKVPILGGQWGSFPQLHTVGSLVFFIYFGVVLLFGRRADCGWCCPCVTARETIGYPFREKTVKNTWWWHLRHLKWFTLAFLIFYLILMIIDASTAYNRAGKYFYNFVTYTYYGSFLLIPLTGNRNFCRILCPFAALWGVLSVSGFYRIKANQEECTACRKCEEVCDMGIPISRLVREKGQIRSLECMGCGRCVHICPTNVLSFHSVFGFIKDNFPVKETGENVAFHVKKDLL
jgi:polyferredoxin